MPNTFEYWDGRKGLQMWAVLDTETVEVQFPFHTEQAEKLQTRRDYVGSVHHLKRNEGAFIVNVVMGDLTLDDECRTLEEAADRCRVLAYSLKQATAV